MRGGDDPRPTQSRLSPAAVAETLRDADELFNRSLAEAKAGSVVGGTDEIGEKAVDVVHPIRDFHVTLLHLLGLDDNKLTYLHGGRFKQLSQFGGKVIRELLG